MIQHRSFRSGRSILFSVVSLIVTSLALTGCAASVQSQTLQDVQGSQNTIQDFDTNSNKPTVHEVIKLVKEVSPKILVSNNSQTLLSDPYPKDYNFAFLNRTAGVWCGDAAVFMMNAARQMGWKAAVLSYGFLGDHSLTHAVTLIFSDIGWIVADSYLGNVHTKPLINEIDQLQSGNVLDSVVDFGVTRDVLFTSIPTSKNPSWLIGRKSTRPLPCEKSGNNFVCTVTHDETDLFKIHKQTQLTLDMLEARSLPRNMSYLKLFPYGIFDGVQYEEISNLSMLYRDLDRIQTMGWDSELESRQFNLDLGRTS